jgi:poly-gamma-glutamate synthesis protein (capsule biosynthesis protein)
MGWRVISVVAVLAVATLAAPRGQPARADTQPTLPPGGSFFDDDGNVHEPLIEAIAAGGITQGCRGARGDLYCPHRVVTRGEMAAFLVRALGLPPTAIDAFSDDEGSIFEADIDRLSAAGITRGCAPGRFCPDRAVSRGEMAALLTRGFGYTTRAEERFVDDDDSIFEADIETLAAAGVTLGCNPPANNRFCPDEPVRRDQMASFLARALGLSPIAVTPRPSITLAFTGDTLIHLALTHRAAEYGDESGEAYDFRPMFEPVRGLLSAADLAICHLEVPLSADNSVLSGYPLFSAPAGLAESLAWAGYDGCSTASNHSIDQGAAGVTDTLDVLDAAGLSHAGTARSAAEADQITMYDAAGVSVAHLAATWWLNGLHLPEDKPWLAELIDVDRLRDQAARARSEGADLVVVSIHCCTEYSSTPTAYQVELAATLLASPNIDLVIGHHAHVLQPAAAAAEEYVAYGLGNFLSGQLGSDLTRDGAILGVEAVPRGDVWAVRKLTATPTWVASTTYRILPAAETVQAGWGSSWLDAQLAASWRRSMATLERYGVTVTPSAVP